NGGCIVTNQKTNGVGLQAVPDEWLHRLAIQAGRTFVDAQHDGYAGAVDVGVQQADLGAQVAQCQGQVDRGGTFAHAALARRQHNNIFDNTRGAQAFLNGVYLDHWLVIQYLQTDTQWLQGWYKAVQQAAYPIVQRVAQR